MATFVPPMANLLKCYIGEEGHGEEDGGDSTANIGDERQNGGMQAVCDASSGQILEHKNNQS